MEKQLTLPVESASSAVASSGAEFSIASLMTSPSGGGDDKARAMRELIRGSVGGSWDAAWAVPVAAYHLQLVGSNVASPGQVRRAQGSLRSRAAGPARTKAELCMAVNDLAATCSALAADAARVGRLSWAQVAGVSWSLARLGTHRAFLEELLDPVAPPAQAVSCVWALTSPVNAGPTSAANPSQIHHLGNMLWACARLGVAAPPALVAAAARRLGDAEVVAASPAHCVSNILWGLVQQPAFWGGWSSNSATSQWFRELAQRQVAPERLGRWSAARALASDARSSERALEAAEVAGRSPTKPDQAARASLAVASSGVKAASGVASAGPAGVSLDALAVPAGSASKEANSHAARFVLSMQLLKREQDALKSSLSAISADPRGLEAGAVPAPGLRGQRADHQARLDKALAATAEDMAQAIVACRQAVRSAALPADTRTRAVSAAAQAMSLPGAAADLSGPQANNLLWAATVVRNHEGSAVIAKVALDRLRALLADGEVPPAAAASVALTAAALDVGRGHPATEFLTDIIDTFAPPVPLTSIGQPVHPSSSSSSSSSSVADGLAADGAPGSHLGAPIAALPPQERIAVLMTTLSAVTKAGFASERLAASAAAELILSWRSLDLRRLPGALRAIVENLGAGRSRGLLYQAEPGSAAFSAGVTASAPTAREMERALLGALSAESAGVSSSGGIGSAGGLRSVVKRSAGSSGRGQATLLPRPLARLAVPPVDGAPLEGAVQLGEAYAEARLSPPSVLAPLLAALRASTVPGLRRPVGADQVARILEALAVTGVRAALIAPLDSQGIAGAAAAAARAADAEASRGSASAGRGGKQRGEHGASSRAGGRGGSPHRREDAFSIRVTEALPVTDEASAVSVLASAVSTMADKIRSKLETRALRREQTRRFQVSGHAGSSLVTKAVFEAAPKYEAVWRMADAVAALPAEQLSAFAEGDSSALAFPQPGAAAEPADVPSRRAGRGKQQRLPRKGSLGTKSGEVNPVALDHADALIAASAACSLATLEETVVAATGAADGSSSAADSDSGLSGEPARTSVAAAPAMRLALTTIHNAHRSLAADQGARCTTLPRLKMAALAVARHDPEAYGSMSPRDAEDDVSAVAVGGVAAAPSSERGAAATADGSAPPSEADLAPLSMADSATPAEALAVARALLRGDWNALGIRSAHHGGAGLDGDTTGWVTQRFWLESCWAEVDVFAPWRSPVRPATLAVPRTHPTRLFSGVQGSSDAAGIPLPAIAPLVQLLSTSTVFFARNKPFSPPDARDLSALAAGMSAEAAFASRPEARDPTALDRLLSEWASGESVPGAVAHLQLPRADGTTSPIAWEGVADALVDAHPLARSVGAWSTRQAVGAAELLRNSGAARLAMMEAMSIWERRARAQGAGSTLPGVPAALRLGWELRRVSAWAAPSPGVRLPITVDLLHTATGSTVRVTVDVLAAEEEQAVWPPGARAPSHDVAPGLPPALSKLLVPRSRLGPWAASVHDILEAAVEERSPRPPLWQGGKGRSGSQTRPARPIRGAATVPDSVGVVWLREAEWNRIRNSSEPADPVLAATDSSAMEMLMEGGAGSVLEDAKEADSVARFGWDGSRLTAAVPGSAVSGRAVIGRIGPVTPLGRNRIADVLAAVVDSAVLSAEAQLGIGASSAADTERC